MHLPMCVTVPSRPCRRGQPGACARCPHRPLTHEAVIRDWKRGIQRGTYTLEDVPGQIREQVAAAVGLRWSGSGWVDV